MQPTITYGIYIVGPAPATPRAEATAVKKEFIEIEGKTLALKMRALWMQKMGFSEEEISEACVDDGSPIDLAIEQENLRAAEELKVITPSASVLESLAVKR